MAKQNCSHVFPNYDARFSHPGKLKQIELFRMHDAPHPNTTLFSDMKTFTKQITEISSDSLYELPFVFKFDWGGEGDFVHLIKSFKQLDTVLDLAQKYEQTG